MSTRSQRQPSESQQRSSGEDSDPPIKRSRVVMACVRCRSRKQKCDGALQSCSTCRRLGARCRYKPKSTPGRDEKQLYVAALEARVAELETFISSTGHPSVGDDHWIPMQNQNRDSQLQYEIGRLPNTIKSLISDASSNDAGPESEISLGRILGSVLRSRRLRTTEWQSDDKSSTRSVSRSELVNAMGPMFVSSTVATKLFNGWLKHIAVRHPVIHTPRLRELHARRDTRLDIYEKSLLHLVYANSGLFLERAGETGDFFAEQHYEAALEHMDDMLELKDTRSISYLFLMALYCLRAPRDPGAWTLAGLAMRLCIELGIHRRSSSSDVSIESELNKRIFWACFFLDREISGAIARPAAIAIQDVDAELPIDIDEDIDNIEALRQAAETKTDRPASPPTSLTIFIHFVRLKVLQGKIDAVIYRVDRPMHFPVNIIGGFLDQLLAWKQVIPAEFYAADEYTGEPVYGIDIFLISYYRSVRSLLYRQLSEVPVNLQYLRLCAEAGAGICEGYKRLHRKFANGYSPISLQTVFLAGLTMLYCAWLSPEILPDVSGPISDCNIMLYIMTDRWPLGPKYRDVFESLQELVTKAIPRASHQDASAAARAVDFDVIEWERELDLGFTGGIRNDISQMIASITGCTRTESQT
ncbi:fungal-specific transcription factor domain-containing protein [Hypoxylon cercidicola]|nr:fungal-specific transcription factor domain-containing protein [Hypoxylon cercidicola]